MTKLKGKCIEWQWRKNAKGYGVILMGGKQFFAHRLAVALSGRNIPKSKMCDHLCRNHSCINPEHIELVSPRENVLRGESPVAKYAKSKFCTNGHPFTKENTRIFRRKNGKTERHCKKCYADREFVRRRKTGYLKNRDKHKLIRYKYGNTK